MSLMDDIVKAQYKPKAVLSEQFETAENEVLTFSLMLVFGLLVFISLVPQLAVVARESGDPLSSLLLGPAFATLGLVPMVLYLVAAMQRGLAILFGGTGSGGRARRGVVWALLASTPFMLASGILSETWPFGLIFAIASLTVFLINWILAIYLNEVQS